MNKRTKKEYLRASGTRRLLFGYSSLLFPYSGSLARHLNQMLSGLHGHQFTGRRRQLWQIMQTYGPEKKNMLTRNTFSPCKNPGSHLVTAH